MKHNHHIIPRHMGGSNDPSNLIELTIEEHADAHRDLWEYCGHWQDYVAWKALAGQITHAEANRLQAIFSNTGRKHSEESKRKTSESLMGRQVSTTTRQKIAASLSGIPLAEKTKSKMKEAWITRKSRGFSEETRRKMSESRKGKKHSPKTLEKMKISAQKRWN